MNMSIPFREIFVYDFSSLLGVRQHYYCCDNCDRCDSCQDCDCNCDCDSDDCDCNDFCDNCDCDNY